MAANILPRDLGGRGADPVICWVYDPVTLALARMTQPILEAGNVAVSGSVTANAGTNLNTSALAVEAGGNLAAAATSLGIMDDWDSSDKCKVQTFDQFGFSADCTPNSELVTTEKIRLVGTIFNGATLDANFWSNAVSTGTAAVAASELVVTSGTANGHYARVWSVRRANWVTGTSNKFRTQARFASSDADVTVKFGVGWGATMPTVTDGAYFKLVGSALSVCTMAATTEAPVASASFNGTYVAPTWTNNNTFEILYSLGKVYFLINGIIIHTATFATTHWTSGTTNFHAFVNVTNTGDSSAIAHTFRMMNIARLGQMLTMPQYYHIVGNAATHILKYGGGILHKIIFNNTTGTSVTIYDQTSAAAPQVGIITTTTAALGAWDYEMPFFNGLTIVTVGNDLDATVVYE